MLQCVHGAVVITGVRGTLVYDGAQLKVNTVVAVLRGGVVERWVE